MKHKPDRFKEAIDKMTEGETGQVPLYRSYGVRKKVNPFIIAFNLFLGRILTVLLIGFELSVIVICAVTFYLYADLLMTTFVTVALSSFFLTVHTRVIRRRLGFMTKLKKLCKKNKYKLEYKRGFFKMLSWNEKEDPDVIVKAGKYTYYAKFATPKKPLSSMTFLSKDEIRYTKHARKNIFTLIFGFKDKSKILSLRFPEYIDEKDKYSVKAIIVNPKPRDIMVKTQEGPIVPTGTGEKIYGYTIFTGKGFMESIKRNAEEREEIKF